MKEKIWFVCVFVCVCVCVSIHALEFHLKENLGVYCVVSTEKLQTKVIQKVSAMRPKKGGGWGAGESRRIKTEVKW